MKDFRFKTFFSLSVATTSSYLTVSVPSAAFTPYSKNHCNKPSTIPTLMFCAYDRRLFVSEVLVLTSPLLFVSSEAQAASVPVQRAVGSGESRCREEGNCLEKFELDGAVGWNWGGTERCDARDSQCGPDGRIREAPLQGEDVPPLMDGLSITDIIELTLKIGTGSTATSDSLRIGLYGKACPELVKEIKDLCGKGIVSSPNLLLGAPVRLGLECGTLTFIRPDERLEFGVPSQKVAYAKSISRTAKAPDDFVPQPRPSGSRLDLVKSEQSARSHGAAGLLSVPKDGIGFGVGPLVKDDEAYSASFQITAVSLPDMDKEGRKVIGQLMDKTSMNLLARLAGIPIRKKLPGQNGGSPLIKVSVQDCVLIGVAGLEERDT